MAGEISIILILGSTLLKSIKVWLYFKFAQTGITWYAEKILYLNDGTIFV